MAIRHGLHSWIVLIIKKTQFKNRAGAAIFEFCGDVKAIRDGPSDCRGSFWTDRGMILGGPRYDLGLTKE